MATGRQELVALYLLADNCKYGQICNEMIHAWLVVRLRDSSLSERLQLDGDLDLEQQKKAVQQCKAIHKQQQTLQDCHKESTAIAALQVKGHG